MKKHQLGKYVWISLQASCANPRFQVSSKHILEIHPFSTLNHDCGRKVLGVSKNNGTPKSSILIGFSIINHPFWDTPIFGNIRISPAFMFVLRWTRMGSRGRISPPITADMRQQCLYVDIMRRYLGVVELVSAWFLGEDGNCIYTKSQDITKMSSQKGSNLQFAHFFKGFLKFSVSQLNFIIFSRYAGGSSVRTVERGVVVEKYQLDREDGSYVEKVTHLYHNNDKHTELPCVHTLPFRSKPSFAPTGTILLGKQHKNSAESGFFQRLFVRSGPYTVDGQLECKKKL